MLRRRIDQVHTISESGEPAGVDSCAPAGVDDRGRSRREMANNQFLHARMLELKPALTETRLFLGIPVVSNNSLDGVVVGHYHFLPGSKLKRLRATHATVRRPIAQLHGQMAGGVFERFKDARHGLRVDLVNGSTQPQAGLDSAVLVEDRSANATGVEVVF